MDALADQGVKVDRQGCHQRLALTGFHLGDLALVQNDAAEQLYIKMALTKSAFSGFTNRRESLLKKIVERLAAGEAFLQPAGAAGQFFVVEVFELRFERVDSFDPLLHELQNAVVLGTKQCLGDGAEHGGSSFVTGGHLEGRCPAEMAD